MLQTVGHEGNGGCSETLQLCARNGFALAQRQDEGDGNGRFLGEDAGVGLTVGGVDLVEDVCRVNLTVGNEEMEEEGVGRLCQ